MKSLKPVEDNANWVGSQLSSESNWRYLLTSQEINELKQMAVQIRPSLNGDPNQLLLLPKEQFKLGVFESRLKKIYADIQQGAGIALIRGLPIHELELLDTAIIYWGIGLHLGHATPNNPEGDMLGHITDLGKTQKDANSRGYQTREAMDYHCDQCDIVGLMCIRGAKTGGISKVASSIAMYNELVRTYPEHAQALTEALYWSKLGEHGEGEQPYYKSPVFNFLNGKLCVAFGAKHIEKGHDLPDTPPLTELQLDAIRLAEQIADKQRCEMVLEPGDMQFLNNYVAVHTRSAYVDHDNPKLKRLLWRLWLTNPNLRSRTAYAENFQAGIKLGLGKKQIRL